MGLRVLDFPFVPLHTNAAEGDIREFVTKRKVSGGTRSQDGKKSRDTFLSLKKTCRKLGVSFWRYLNSRLKCDLVVPRLESILRLKAAPSWIKKVLKKLKENLTKVVFFFFWKNHYQRLLRCYEPRFKMMQIIGYKKTH